MSPYKHVATLALLTLSLAACGRKPNALPVFAKQCDTVLGKNAVTVQARIENDADKPASSIRVSLDFYHDFKFSRVTGVAAFKPQLEPGKTRSVPLVLTDTQNAAGQAQRCAVTHVTYADGTTADANP